MGLLTYWRCTGITPLPEGDRTQVIYKIRWHQSCSNRHQQCIGRVQKEGKMLADGVLGCADNADYRSVVWMAFLTAPETTPTQRRDKVKVLNAQLRTWVETPKSSMVALRELLISCWADMPRD